MKRTDTQSYFWGQAGDECDECRMPIETPLYSMGYQFCSEICRDVLENQMEVVYSRMEEIEGMLLTEI